MEVIQIVIESQGKSRTEIPQKLAQLRPRSHTRHLVEKRTAKKPPSRLFFFFFFGGGGGDFVVHSGIVFFRAAYHDKKM